MSPDQRRPQAAPSTGPVASPRHLTEFYPVPHLPNCLDTLSNPPPEIGQLPFAL
jgi:hypothetical protein